MVSVVCVVVAVVVVVVCVCACVVYTLKSLCFNMCAWCRHTRGRFERTHGDVLSGHTEKGGNHRQFCLPKFAHIGLSRASFRGSPKATLGSYPFQVLRIGREQHVPDSSNQSLCLIKLFSFSYPEGNSGRNQL